MPCLPRCENLCRTLERFHPDNAGRRNGLLKCPFGTFPCTPAGWSWLQAGRELTLPHKASAIRAARETHFHLVECRQLHSCSSSSARHTSIGRRTCPCRIGSRRREWSGSIRCRYECLSRGSGWCHRRSARLKRYHLKLSRICAQTDNQRGDRPVDGLDSLGRRSSLVYVFDG